MDTLGYASLSRLKRNHGDGVLNLQVAQFFYENAFQPVPKSLGRL